MEELEGVYRYLKTLVADFRPEDLGSLADSVRREVFPARSTVFREGDRYRKVLFLKRGLLKKSYATEDGKEFVKEFVWEGQSTTPYAAILRDEACTYTMEALEETEALSVEYDAIEALTRTNPRWLAVAKRLADFHFLNREDREMELLKFSAPERYARFKARFPHLLGRLRKQDIAAYLGITPVSLSRLEGRG
ncbi:MAG: Crp/Fnr family transcriptional regulator [Bdellovibrionales bacterium]|nr:Crp/Fnr family transcriptional regulator [Bdellovibrionales bacterium]